jgi:hypothetical protein
VTANGPVGDSACMGRGFKPGKPGKPGLNPVVVYAGQVPYLKINRVYRVCFAVVTHASAEAFTWHVREPMSHGT